MLFVLFATETRKHRSCILYNNVLTCFVTLFNNFLNVLPGCFRNQEFLIVFFVFLSFPKMSAQIRSND